MGAEWGDISPPSRRPLLIGRHGAAWTRFLHNENNIEIWEVHAKPLQGEMAEISPFHVDIRDMVP